MKEELITKAYEVAKERYAALGIDVEKVMEQLQKVAISMHCWQADDVIGFESGSSLTGGIQTTGNYPGKARNMEELRSDILKAASYIPGKHRLNLHEIYGDFGGTFVDRDQVEVKHFESWMQWAAENGMKLDFNSTSFSHPKSGNLSLANPDKGIRDFWIEHTNHSGGNLNPPLNRAGMHHNGILLCIAQKVFINTEQAFIFIQRRQ